MTAASQVEQAAREWWATLGPSLRENVEAKLLGVSAFIAGAASERERVLAVVQGHRCEGYEYVEGAAVARSASHPGQSCAEAIAAEIREQGKP